MSSDTSASPATPPPDPAPQPAAALPPALQSEPFWKTMPVLITAIATLITALVGAATLFISKSSPPPATPPATPAAMDPSAGAVYSLAAGEIGAAPVVAQGVSLKNARISARFFNPDIASPSWSYGINFRMNEQSLYALIIHGDGRAFLRVQKAGALSDVVAPFALRHWESQGGAANDIVLMVNDSNVSLSTNGAPEASIDLSDPPMSGRIEMMANYFVEESKDIKVRFEDFEVRTLP